VLHHVKAHPDDEVRELVPVERLERRVHKDRVESPRVVEADVALEPAIELLEEIRRLDADVNKMEYLFLSSGRKVH
jgi:hypothetical protein